MLEVIRQLSMLLMLKDTGVEIMVTMMVLLQTVRKELLEVFILLLVFMMMVMLLLVFLVADLAILKELEPLVEVEMVTLRC